ncbi:hypothetical protein R3P38DRAFT_2808372 [Favolaschia claudopus]|uniref:Uncharacterized protein n=1 Tax=Favolaschia claudopus TaxID=2862362 RepID=A0AAV9ZF25_9AGAR
MQLTEPTSRPAWIETWLRQSIERRLPWLSPDIPDLVKHCVRGHTQCTRQHRSTDVKVWDSTTTRTLSFGKETADQAIQQGNARVSNGIQQDVGELAAHSCPLERKGNHGAPSQQKDVLKRTTPRATIHHQVQWQAINPACLEAITTGNCVPKEDTKCWNQGTDPERLATVMGNPAPDSVKKALNREELGSKLTAWEGILPEIVIYPLDPREFGNTTGIRQHAPIVCLIQKKNIRTHH